MVNYTGREEFDCRYKLHIEARNMDAQLSAFKKLGLPWAKSARDLAGTHSGFSRKETRRHQCESIANALYLSPFERNPTPSDLIRADD